MTDQAVPEQPVNPTPADPPTAPVEQPTQPESLAPHTSDVLPQITTAQPAPTAGELRAAGYDVPADIPDDEVPHKYAADSRALPTDEPKLVEEFPAQGVPRWEDGKVVGGDEA